MAGHYFLYSVCILVAAYAMCAASSVNYYFLIGSFTQCDPQDIAYVIGFLIYYSFLPYLLCALLGFFGKIRALRAYALSGAICASTLGVYILLTNYEPLRIVETIQAALIGSVIGVCYGLVNRKVKFPKKFSKQDML